jgi:hypothetical protein
MVIAVAMLQMEQAVSPTVPDFAFQLSLAFRTFSWPLQI